MHEDERTWFAIGYMKKMAELGITPAEFEKRSFGLADLIQNSALLAGTIGVGLPIGAGYLTGYARAKLVDKTEEDVALLKDRQSVDYMKLRTAQLLEQIEKRKKEEAAAAENVKVEAIA
jgi:hypothetical protein